MRLIFLHSFPEFLIFAYALFGTISVLGYGPQIWTLARSTGRSMSTPITTWLLWSCEAIIAFLYALVVLKDPLTSLFFGLDSLCSVTIVGLTIWNRFYRFPPEKQYDFAHEKTASQ